MVYPRKPLPHAEQIAILKQLVRELNRELTRKYDAFFAATKGRRECPFEARIRSRQIDAAREHVKLAEACLLEMQRQEAMFYAPHQPGDRVCVMRDEPGARPPSHYLIIDIEPCRKTFSYSAVPLTKQGVMYKSRGPYPLSPGPHLKPSDLKVNAEAEREAEYYRTTAKVSRELSYVLGRLDQFEPQKDYSGATTRYLRRNRLSVD